MSERSNKSASPDPWAAWTEQLQSMQSMLGGSAAINPFASLAAMNPMLGATSFGASAGAPDAASLMRAIDPAEIERRIQDMRAVEAWLKLSLTTLEMSIKTMEMQRDAYASFQNIRAQAQATGEAASAAMKRAVRRSSPAKRSAAKRK
jgi:TolA-binding protein